MEKFPGLTKMLSKKGKPTKPKKGESIFDKKKVEQASKSFSGEDALSDYERAYEQMMEENKKKNGDK